MRAFAVLNFTGDQVRSRALSPVFRMPFIFEFPRIEKMEPRAVVVLAARMIVLCTLLQSKHFSCFLGSFVNGRDDDPRQIGEENIEEHGHLPPFRSSSASMPAEPVRWNSTADRAV